MDQNRSCLGSTVVPKGGAGGPLNAEESRAADTGRSQVLKVFTSTEYLIFFLCGLGKWGWRRGSAGEGKFQSSGYNCPVVQSTAFLGHLFPASSPRCPPTLTGSMKHTP